jgi:hypothetical protein
VQRILILVAVLYIAWRLLSAWGKRIAGPGRGADEFSRFSRRRSRRGADTDADESSGAELLQCEGCGTCVPENNVVTSPGGGVFCSHRCSLAADDAEKD